MDASEFLGLAAKLVTLGQAGARSAVSRAYYAVFHQARELLVEISSETMGSGRAHYLVPLYLQESGHTGCIAAGDLLSDLHSARLKADYELANARCEDIAFAKRGVESATEIARLLASFKGECETNPVLKRDVRNGIARINLAHR